MNLASQNNPLARRLDPGLQGEACAERMNLLRQNLAAPTSSAPPDLEHLARIAAELRQGRITVRSAARQYLAASDAGRWPILVVRPASADLDEARAILTEEGFLIDEFLTPAYAEVHLLPVRVPPEAIFIEALASLSCVDRVERSWMRGALPQGSPHEDRQLSHPDHLLNRADLPTELVSKRDPLRVALIDSGIDATHPALKTRLLDQRTFRRGLTGVGDQIGHGTAVAGIIARLCAAATFISAKVMDNKREPNLDDVIRAVGWVRRHKPDVVVCSLLFQLPADGRSILSGLLAELVSAGAVVVVPAADSAGALLPPSDAQQVLSVCPQDAPPGGKATLRVSGAPVLAPRSIQADNARFPTLDVPKWTALSGPAAAAATAAGTATLMLRAARLCRVDPTPRDIQQGLLDTFELSGPGAFNPDAALNLYVSRVTSMNLATQTGRMALASLKAAGIEPAADPYAEDQETQTIGADLLSSFRQHDQATVQHDVASLAAGMRTASGPYARPAADPFGDATVQSEIPKHLLGGPSLEELESSTRPMELSQLTQLRSGAKPTGKLTTVDGREHPPMLDLSRRGESEDTRRELAAESWPDNTQQLRIIRRPDGSTEIV